MKNILAIDCATSSLGISLKTQNKVYSNEILDGFKHSENLIPRIEELLLLANLSIKDINLLVCTRGPGSFTGLRIGISTFKGISLALGVPLVSVPTLDLYSYDKNNFKGVVIPLIDARKNCYYTAIYRNGEKETEYLDVTQEELLEIIKNENSILLTGFDANTFFMNVKEDPRFTMDNHFAQNYTKYLVDLGLVYYNKFGPDSIDQGPSYIRKSEAEILLQKKSLL